MADLGLINQMANAYLIGGGQQVNPDGSLARVDLVPQLIGTANAGVLSGDMASTAAPMPNPIQQAMQTQNAPRTRVNAPLAVSPSNRIGMDEAMIRIGGAVMGGAQQGGLNAMQSGIEKYGAIQDYNRSRALDEYNAKVKMINALNKNKGKKGAATGAVSPYNAIVLNTIDSVIPRVEEDINGILNRWLGLGGTQTGTIGQILSMVGGTDAYDLESDIETIKANIGFDRLQQMRMQSPTGGALGSVSERELSQLNAALGNLNTGQSPEQLLKNLKIVRDQYERTIIALQNDYAADGMSFNVPNQTGGSSQNNDVTAQADAIVGN